MNILTVENTTFDLANLPNESVDMRFSVLDNTDVNDPDYYFIPLIFLETFTSPALVLRIGQHKIKMPIDWHVLIGEEELGDLEALPLSSLNDRSFNVFVYNNRTCFYPKFMPIEIIDIYPETEWYTPKIKPGQFLSVPLWTGDNPLCAFFSKDITKMTHIVNYQHAW